MKFSALVATVALSASVSALGGSSEHGHAFVARQHRPRQFGSAVPSFARRQNDPQTSLTLDSSQVQPGLALDGQQVPAANQVASATSTNNFINFCLTRSDLPLTNGLQVKTGSCNPTPMGVLIAQTLMPSSKFVSPANLDTILADTTFTIQMKINNLETGNFVNAQANYYSAPANTNSAGLLIGHSHVVVEAIDSLTSTTPGTPTAFAFFKGFNEAAVNGILSATVDGGLPAGTYKMSSINSAANHQPVLAPVAQHGSLDDAVYFVVSSNAADVGTGNANGGGASAGNSGSAGNAGSTGNSGSTGGNGAVASSSAAATTTAAAVTTTSAAAVVTTSAAAVTTSAAAVTTTTAAAGTGNGKGGFGGFGGKGGKKGTSSSAAVVTTSNAVVTSSAALTTSNAVVTTSAALTTSNAVVTSTVAASSAAATTSAAASGKGKGGFGGGFGHFGGGNGAVVVPVTKTVKAPCSTSSTPAARLLQKRLAELQLEA